MMKGFDVFSVDSLKWQDGPATLPLGAKIALLEGDPTKDGPFVFRVKVPDGYRIPTHTHPKNERVTIIAGSFYVSMMDNHGVSNPKEITAGAYGHWPAGMKHMVGPRVRSCSNSTG
jgi:quercetin dioxygenase-like cupin family protein